MEGTGQAVTWPGWVSTVGSPSQFYPRYLRPPCAWQDRGPFPCFWPTDRHKGTGPSDRCSPPPRQGLQPPSGSLVFLYNKIVGDTSVLVSSVILLEGEGTSGPVEAHRKDRVRAGTASPMEAAQKDLGALSLLFHLTV